MKFTLFEDLLYDDAYGDGTEDIKINITQANVEKLDDIIYQDAYGADPEETLDE